MGIAIGVLLGTALLPVLVGLVVKVSIDAYSTSVNKRRSKYSLLMFVLGTIVIGALEFYFFDLLSLQLILGVALFGPPAVLILLVADRALSIRLAPTTTLSDEYLNIRKKWLKVWLIFVAIPAVIALLLMVAPSVVDAGDYYVGLLSWLSLGLISYPIFIFGAKIQA